MKKDLNIEEKAKAYDEVLSRAREEYLYGLQPVKEAIEHIFPEIKKNDDTKIRETLIELVKANERSGYTLFNNVSTSSMINWLEKQGEQEEPQVYKPKDDAVITYSKSEGYNFAEPKFNIGDWIVRKDGKKFRNGDSFAQIKGFSGKQCAIGSDVETGILCLWYHYDDIKHWSIENAKDGDVLCLYECDEPKIVFILRGRAKKHYGLRYHCFYNIMYPHFDSDSTNGGLVPKNEADVKPATKEQRELLFQKMNEAGYKWDAENKKPIKI